MATNTNDTAQFDPIDAQRALELLEKAVAERGEEYVYEKVGAEADCVYVDGGMPSCMVGVALTLAGVPVEALQPMNDVRALSLPLDLPFISREAADVFDAAQSAQDAGRSWGAAFADAQIQAAVSS